MRLQQVTDTNALQDWMPYVARLLGASWATCYDVRKALKEAGLTNYDIYLTVKGAAITYPHVKEVLDQTEPDDLPWVD
jgi:hypothetical protein